MRTVCKYAFSSKKSFGGISLHFSYNHMSLNSLPTACTTATTFGRMTGRPKSFSSFSVPKIGPVPAWTHFSHSFLQIFAKGRCT